MRNNLSAFAVASFLSLSVFLAGCSTSFAPTSEAPVETAFGSIGGEIHGGQQPITGAQIYAFQTSTTAYGGASRSLILSTNGVTGYTPTEDTNVSDATYGDYYVPTDNSGGFEISSSTTCTAGTVVYLYSLGGDTAPGVSNPNAGELALLGVCPANGLLVNSVVATGTSAHIFMNEVSTVAAAYALAGFATDAVHIGALTSNSSGVVTDTLAQTGIQTAAGNATQLFTDIGGNGASKPANATTANGNGTVPQQEIDSLANILAACVNTSGAVPDGSGGSGTNVCNILFNDVTHPTGKPTDTASAAIDIAKFPYFSKVSTVFNLGSSYPPFSPALSVAPNDFSITLAFTGGGLATSSAHSANSLAVAADGSVWSVNPGANTISHFNALGVPSNASGYSGNGLNEPYSVSVGTDTNIYVINHNTDTGSAFYSSGAAILTEGAAAIQAPTDLEFDAAGNLWITNYGGNGQPAAVSIVGPQLNTIATDTTNATSPAAVALGYTYAFVADSGKSQIAYYDGHSETISSTGNHSTSYPTVGIAADSSGYRAWATENSTYIARAGIGSGNNSLIETSFSASGEYTTPAPLGIAMDGANNVWASDSANGSIYEAADGGTLSNGSYGFPALGNAVGVTPVVKPAAVAVDGSGNVWYNTLNDAKLYEIIGSGTPVATPIAYAVVNSLLGTEP